MAAPLAIPSDVEDLWRPLTPADYPRVPNLIDKASALLRQRLPWVDARVTRFRLDPTDAGGLDPLTVASVVATVVKRFLVNPDGATNSGETTGPYSQTKGFALRGDKDVRGELYVSDQDVKNLLVPSKGLPRIGTIKSRPRLAPWPYGDVGGPSLGASGSMDLWLLDQQGGLGELPYLPSHNTGA